MTEKKVGSARESFPAPKEGLVKKLKGINLPLWPAAFLLFVLSVLIRGLIMPGSHILITYYDELLYWGVAKTFWTQPAFTIYHIPIEFSKFLYSMLLSPLFLIRNAAVRMSMAQWLNAVLISFSVFPACHLARKLSPSRGVQLASLVLFMASPIMNYAEKYTPECLYLPLCLYLMLGYYTLFRRITSPESHSLRGLCATSAPLGILAYAAYLAKEAAAAFVAAFLIRTLIAAAIGLRRREQNWKRYLSAAGAHAGVIAACYIAVKLIFGLGYSYSHQIGLDNVGSMFKIEFLIHCLISNGLYICVALFALPVLYWQLKKNRQARPGDEGVAHENWVVFFFTAFALTVFFISYSISLVEDFGKANIRLHTRYCISFLFPLFALVFEEIRKSPKKIAHTGVAGVLIMGIGCVLLLSPNRYISTYDSFDTWHVQNAINCFNDITEEAEEGSLDASPIKAFFADQTDGSKEVSYNHGLLIAASAFAAAAVLFVVFLYRKRALSIALFFCVILGIEIYNNVETVRRISRFTVVTDAESQAYTQLDQDVRQIVGDENLLIISTEKLEKNKRAIEAFFSFDWYSTLTSGLKKVIGPEGVIDLTQAQIPVSMTQFTNTKTYPKGTAFSYVLCLKDIRFNGNCVEEVLYSKGTGYHLYRLLDPSFLDIDYIKEYYEE